VTRITKRRVLALVRQWRTKLHLSEWHLGVVVDTIPPDAAARADASASPEYREATLRFDPAEIDPAELEEMVVHELLHCHVETLGHLALVMAGEDAVRKEAVRMAEEELVTRLTRVCLGLGTVK
jgi:hypothetical protein